MVRPEAEPLVGPEVNEVGPLVGPSVGPLEDHRLDFI